MPQASRLLLPSLSAKRQAENKRAWNEQRSCDQADFFTIGYTGRKIEEILEILKAHGVRTLIDIRRNAISMYRPELSKTNLSRLLTEHGMCYTHQPELGVPRDIRAKAVDSGSRQIIWDWYDTHIVGSVLNLHQFLNGFEHPVALMCTEIDPHECHRHRLSLALEGMGLNGFDL